MEYFNLNIYENVGVQVKGHAPPPPLWLHFPKIVLPSFCKNIKLYV